MNVVHSYSHSHNYGNDSDNDYDSENDLEEIDLENTHSQHTNPRAKDSLSSNLTTINLRNGQEYPQLQMHESIPMHNMGRNTEYIDNNNSNNNYNNNNNHNHNRNEEHASTPIPRPLSQRPRTQLQTILLNVKNGVLLLPGMYSCS